MATNDPIVLIGKDASSKVGRLTSVNQPMSRILPAGNYTSLAGVAYNKNTKFLTLTSLEDLVDRGTDMWVAYSDGVNPVPDLAEIREASAYRYKAIRASGPGILSSRDLLQRNQGFKLWFYRWMSVTTPSDNYVRIMWGQNAAGDFTDDPRYQAQWRLTLNPGTDLDTVELYVESKAEADPLDNWTVWQTGKLTDTRETNFLMPQGIQIEPCPPRSLLISGFGSLAGSMRVDAYKISEVEKAEEDGVPFWFWDAGHVSVELGTCGSVYLAPTTYASTGSMVSSVIRLNEETDTLPQVAYNVHDPKLDADGNLVATKTPGTVPDGTTASITLIHEDDEDPLEAGDLPVSSFRYLIELEANGTGTLSPFIDQASIASLPEASAESADTIDASDDLLGGSITMTLDNMKREGQLVLNNTEGTYNHLLTSDMVPVTIALGDYPLFTGFAARADEDTLGPSLTYGSGDGVAAVRKINVDLQDNFKLLDQRYLTKTLGFACDGHYHNEAIWYLMKNIMGFDPDDLMMPKFYQGDEWWPEIILDPGTWDGSAGEDWHGDEHYGVSVLLTSAYNADYPVWVPEMGETATDFLTRLHEAGGGWWWQVFFGRDGKFYYWPQYDHRVAAENVCTFEEKTSLTEGDVNKYPIIGQVKERIDFTNFRNDFWVFGEWRDVKEFYNTAPPVIDGLSQEFMPIVSNYPIVESWDKDAYEAGTYPYFVGQRRSRIYVNPSLITQADCDRVCRWMARMYGRPRVVYSFTSYYVEHFRPSNWGTLKFNDKELTVRLRSVKVNLDKTLKGLDPRETGNDKVGYLAEYEVDKVEDWENW